MTIFISSKPLRLTDGIVMHWVSCQLEDLEGELLVAPNTAKILIEKDFTSSKSGDKIVLCEPGESEYKDYLHTYLIEDFRCMDGIEGHDYISVNVMYGNAESLLNTENRLETLLFKNIQERMDKEFIIRSSDFINYLRWDFFDGNSLGILYMDLGNFESVINDKELNNIMCCDILNFQAGAHIDDSNIELVLLPLLQKEFKLPKDHPLYNSEEEKDIKEDIKSYPSHDIFIGQKKYAKKNINLVLSLFKNFYGSVIPKSSMTEYILKKAAHLDKL